VADRLAARPQRMHVYECEAELVRNCTSYPLSSYEENMPWVCYVWTCSGHPKCFMTAAASPFPCARRRPCCSTWRSKEACIPAASWLPSCGPIVSPTLLVRACAPPLLCCAACSLTPTLRLP